LQYKGVPRFSPEHFAGVMILDPMKRKQLKKGLDELSEEGVIQVFRQPGLGDKDPVLGAVGALQFEVLQHRLKTEYGADIRIDRLPYTRIRWIVGEGVDLNVFSQSAETRLVEDMDGLPVILFTTEWAMNWIMGQHPKIKFSPIAP
jgi:peptide chain release factor 3